MSTAAAQAELTEAQFRRISALAYRAIGINLQLGKEGLVRSRLSKRLRELGLSSFDAYLEHIESEAGRPELAQMVDALTTNKTDFFREIEHFHFLREHVLPALTRDGRGRLRIWSAACSSGEEPYSIAMLLREELPSLDRMDVRILATDISARVLARARDGEYGEATLAPVSQALLRKYFTPLGPASSQRYRASDGLRSLVRFARLNLIGPWPMRGPFDVIFCRNVMIYFDKATQERLVARFWELLAPGGYLLVGHSESLTSLAHDFRYLRPAVYVK